MEKIKPKQHNNIVLYEFEICIFIKKKQNINININIIELACINKENKIKEKLTNLFFLKYKLNNKNTKAKHILYCEKTISIIKGFNNNKGEKYPIFLIK